MRKLLFELRSRSTGDQPLGSELTMALGRACLMVGDVEEASRAFLSVVATAPQAKLRAQAHYGQARVMLGQLETEGVLEASNLALKELALAPLARSAKSVFGALFRWLGALFTTSQRPSADPDRDALAARLYFNAAYASYFLLSPPLFVQGILRGFPLIRSLGTRREAADWYGVAGALCCALGLFKQGQRMIDRSVALSVALKDPQATAIANVSGSIVSEMSGDSAKGTERALEVLREQAQWLDNADYFTLVANFAWIQVMRGHAQLAWSWLERALRRVDETGGGSFLAKGHTFRCYAGPVLAMLGRAEQGHEQLKSYDDFVRTNVPRDVWRRVSLIAHRSLAGELSGAPDAELEALFDAHRALGKKPKSYAHQLRHFYVAKLYRRGDQVLRPGSGKAERARLGEALAELKTINRHPTLRAHWLVGVGVLRWAKGQSPDQAWQEALAVAQRSDNSWVEFEVNLLRCRRAKRAGDTVAAEQASSVALGLARTHGWVRFEQRVAQAS